MGSIKDRNGMDLAEAEDIKKRCSDLTNMRAKDMQFKAVSATLEKL